MKQCQQFVFTICYGGVWWQKVDYFPLYDKNIHTSPCSSILTTYSMPKYEILACYSNNYRDLETLYGFPYVVGARYGTHIEVPIYR